MGVVTPGSGCAQFRGLLAEEAVGRLAPRGRVDLDAHLAGCAACRADADDVSRAAGALAWVGPAVADELSRTDGVGTEVVPTGALDAAVAGILAGGGRARSLTPPGPGQVADTRSTAGGQGNRNLRLRGLAPIMAVAAATLLVAGVFTAMGHGAAVTRSVDLAGPSGSHATAVLTAEAWGTSVTLTDPARRSDQVLTVSMAADYGYAWVVGSYRVTSSHGVTVTLACALPADRIRTIAVTDAAGHVVLTGRQSKVAGAA